MIRRSRRTSGEAHSWRVTSEVLVLSPQDLRCLPKSLKKRWHRCRRDLKHSRRKIDEASIHDSRVGARRLMAWVQLLGAFIPGRQAEELQAALKNALDVFDELRDTQVQLRAASELSSRAPLVAEFRNWLRRRAEKYEKKACRRSRKIKWKRLDRLVSKAKRTAASALRHHRPSAANALLLHALQRAFDETIRRQRQIDARDVQTIHQTRVTLKRFRYMLEALAEHLPNFGDDLLNSLHHHQTMMGDIQDAQVLLRTWDKFGRKTAASPEALGKMRRQLLARRDCLVRAWLDAAGGLNEFEPAS